MKKRNELFFSSSEEETIAFGSQIAPYIAEQKSLVVALWGECGCGKTHLAKGIISSLAGIPLDAITSPTFTLLHTYQGKVPIYHFDLYRLKQKEEFFLGGFADCLEGEGICLIEWPDLIKDELPETTLHIELSHKEAGRMIELL